MRVARRLGLTSFGGPIAHPGHYERVYVRKRQWLAPDEYAGLVAPCRMLPGPASSQTGLLERRRLPPLAIVIFCVGAALLSAIAG